jgi:hypothetical protein
VGIAVALWLVLSPGRGAAAELPGAVDAAIARIAPLLSDGHARYEGGAIAAACDSAASPAADMAVLFGLTGWGGGNGSRQFLAILTPLDTDGALRGSETRPYALVGVIPVGADFDRWFDTMEAVPHRVVLHGKRWGAKDAHCCPSRTVRTVYEITPHGIDEVSE